jgi:formylglycine-generating enzyme
MKKLSLIGMILTFGLLSFAQSTLDLKAAQKSLAKINDKLYFSKYEVTNAQYSIFLKDLLANNKTSEFQSAQIDSANWTREFKYCEALTPIYHSHPAYGAYPVVNVSFEGATQFCEWMTDQYNSNEKRKFKKVKFRLPTQEEWITAAKGGNPSAIYPWEGSELKDKNGIPRCNFIRAADDIMGTAGINNDGADLTANVKSYSPNGYELYNMSGNVAEMIAEKGKTMGGSWLDNADAMIIGSTGKYSSYTTPHPTIGFRYVMDIIEE